MWFKKQKQYIYVIVRKDLPLADQMVQVGHACFESGMSYGKKKTHLILLQVNNEDELNKIAEKIKYNNVHFFMFFEPDPIVDGDIEPMGNTALCTQPIFGNTREIFRECSMWVS